MLVLSICYNRVVLKRALYEASMSAADTRSPAAPESCSQAARTRSLRTLLNTRIQIGVMLAMRARHIPETTLTEPEFRGLHPRTVTRTLQRARRTAAAQT